MQDGEIPELSSGGEVHGVGLRLECDAIEPAHDRGDRLASAADEKPNPFRYAVTGLIGDPVDVCSGQIGERPAEVEFSLIAGDLHLIARAPGRSADYRVRQPVTAIGTLRVIADYEYDAFSLADVRRDWRVRALKGEYRQYVLDPSHGGYVIGDIVAVVDLDRMRIWDDDPGPPHAHFDYLLDLEPLHSASPNAL